MGIFPGGVCYFPSSFQKQEKQCPDRDATERTRPVTTPSVPFSHDLRPPFVLTHRLHTSVTMSLFSGIHLRFSHNGRYHRSLWILSNIIALSSSLWPRKPAYLAMIRRSQPSLLQMTPESKNASAVMYATSITISGSKNAKIQLSEATWQNSPKTIKCVWPSCTLCLRRLAETSPQYILWGIGLSACDPESTNASTVMCATLATTSCKKIANISSREATLRHSHKKMRYGLPLDILANAASPKLAPMINCGVSA